MKSLILLLSISTLFMQTNFAQGFDHASFDKLLRKHVTGSGKVNYEGFKADIKEFDAYLSRLSSAEPVPSWSKQEKLVFWINAYNAFTIKKILNSYPLESITKLDKGKPWDVVWIKIGGNKYSLNNIENDIIRKQFSEPRIHFALNCAAKSCPPLLNRAWTATKLEVDLTARTKLFINDPGQNSISAKGMKVSKIFDWYKADFGNLVEFINKYSITKVVKGTKASFTEYDWTLNK